MTSRQLGGFNHILSCVTGFNIHKRHTSRKIFRRLIFLLLFFNVSQILQPFVLVKQNDVFITWYLNWYFSSGTVHKLLQVLIMETPHLCPMSLIKIQHSKWELGDLLEIEHHITTQTNCQHPTELKHWVLSKPVEGSTPLLMACDRGNLDSVKHIVEKWQVDVNATGAYYIFIGPFIKFDLQALDASPLFVAAYQCHYEVVRYLVEKGANIFAETSEDGCLRLSGLTPFYASNGRRTKKRSRWNWFYRRLFW